MYANKDTVTNAFIHIIGPTRNILLGAGLSYAIQNKAYLEIPILFIVPSVYAGYQMYNNKDKIAKWIRENTIS